MSRLTGQNFLSAGAGIVITIAMASNAYMQVNRVAAAWHASPAALPGPRGRPGGRQILGGTAWRDVPV